MEECGKDEFERRRNPVGDRGVDRLVAGVGVAPVPVQEVREVLPVLHVERLGEVRLARGDRARVGVGVPLVARVDGREVREDEREDGDADQNGDELDEAFRDEDQKIAWTAPQPPDLPPSGGRRTCRPRHFGRVTASLY